MPLIHDVCTYIYIFFLTYFTYIFTARNVYIYIYLLYIYISPPKSGISRKITFLKAFQQCQRQLPSSISCISQLSLDCGLPRHFPSEIMFISLSLFDPSDSTKFTSQRQLNNLSKNVHQIQTKTKMASHGGKGRIPMFRACAFLAKPINHCDWFHVITPSLLFNK